MAVTDFTLIRRSMMSRRASTVVVIIALAAGVALTLLRVDLQRSAAAVTDGPTQQAADAPQRHDTIDHVGGLLALVAGAMMSASAALIVFSLSRSVAQRRRSIAVLRLLGWSQARVGWLVLTEAAAIGLLGGVAGVAIRLIGSPVAAKVLLEMAGVVLPPRLDLAATLIVILGTIALATLAGVAPAIIASRAPVAPNLEPPR